MRILLTLFSVSLFASCISIEINSTGAKNLSKNELNLLKPFSQRGNFSNFKQQSPVNLYVIAPEDIATIINENHLVWIHKWRPFCGAESCQLIAPFEKQATLNNVQLSFITETADLDYIDRAVKIATFQSPIYFGDKSYGNNINRARNKMKIDLLKNQNIAPKKYADDYLYKNGTLIYQGGGLIDSLEIILKRNTSLE